MEQQPTIQNIVDQLEQLIMKIILSVLFRLKDEISSLDKKEEIKF